LQDGLLTQECFLDQMCAVWQKANVEAKTKSCLFSSQL
jgi:hypothetical protein